MKFPPFLYIPLTISAIALFGFMADDDPLINIAQKLQKYRVEYAKEKVHIHMDKPYYAIGDNIWLKAYVVNAESNQLSNLSKILYVDLINEKDSIKQSLRLPLTAGMAWGDFVLSDSLREGNYRIRAYTTWMRNFGEGYFFDKTISIGNSISTNYISDVSYTFSKIGNSEKVIANIRYTDLDGNPVVNKDVNYDVQLDFRNILKGKSTTDTNGNIQLSFVNTQPFILKSGRINTLLKINDKVIVSKNFPVKATSSDVDIQFFPEGGNLISGVKSKVGIKAVGADGLGVNVKGHITDQNNNKVADISTEHAGMGNFTLFPTLNNTYKATIRFEDGSEKNYDLPATLEKGYTLAVRHLNMDSLSVKVSVSPSLIGTGPITLVAHTNGIINYTTKNNADAATFSAIIPKNRFSTGILHFTLFSPNNDPAAERLIFINRNDQLNIDLSTVKDEYKPRERVRIMLNHKKKQEKTVFGAFSIAVTDETKVIADETSETTILSNLLLTSDIKGYVEQPNYYFLSNNENTVRQLDNLLLTQGWRRFSWKNILSDSFPAITYNPEREMKISGTVLTGAGKPVPGGKVTLMSSSGEVFLIDTLTDSAGKFSFSNLFFADSTKFVVQARNARDKKNVEIVLDQIPPQLVTKSKNLAGIEVNVNKSMITYLRNSRDQFQDLRRFNMNKSIMLAEVKVVEKKQKVTHSSNLNGAGNADAIITADQLQNCTSLDQCLSGRAAGLFVQNGVAYLFRNMSSSFSGPVPMQLIVDGTYVDPNFLSSINPNDVETIEVLKNIGNTAIYGMRGTGGVLIITTKRGTSNQGYRSFAPGIISYAPKGLYKVREFYSPNYDDPKIDLKTPDLRTTIYWNPHVITNQEGKAYVEFFNADGTGNYKVVVEGLDIEGKIGRSVYRYKVK
ncbi:MAG TPA: TonB-dependent receptor plug domain-containing protein [Sphingobacteriaceae bacterium]|nr:TonB-dependent receptor plug domain-containing protein [Sphingobacteriaceae bacterium]